MDCIDEGAPLCTSFYFKVNRRSIYMKGANMVPLDYYPDRMKSDEEIQWILMSAVSANMNVLRVWGGGMYLDDNFYEAADRAGIMVWQDMMFSCKVYPFATKAWVTNSEIEVRQQMARLQHHASIAMWDMNNEGQAMTSWGLSGDQ